LAAIGEGAALLNAGPAPLWTAIAGVAIFALVAFGSFDVIARVFKWLCITLLTYVVVLFAANVSWAQVGRGLVGAQFQMRILGRFAWPPWRRENGVRPSGTPISL